MRGSVSILYKAYLSVVVLLVLPVNAQQTNSLISNKYPQCNYTVIDTVEVKSRIDVEANLLNQLQHQKAFGKITRKLSVLAKKADADFVILVAKRQSSRNRQNYLAFSAELIKGCALDSSAPIKIAKFNSRGMSQLALPKNTIKIENKLVIKAPVLAKRKQPALQNKSVSIKNGVYTVKLNYSLAQVVEVLGTPTVEMQISESSQVLMYGRQHLFEFKNKKLSAVNSNNRHFTSSLKNRLEFDDRLDDVKWQVEGKYTKLKRLTDKQAKRVNNNEIVFQNKNETLRVLIENRSNSAASEPSYVVNGFRLARIKDTFYKDLVPPNSLSILSFINKQLEQESPTFAISDIPYAPTITAWITPVKRLYTFGQHVAIEALGDRVTSIFILESLYTAESPLYKAGLWQVGQYKQGMSAESAKAIAGENGDYFNEELEVVNNGVTMRFYFYEQKQQVKLYAGEISFY